uniref:DUF4430 domain-containing protein n=1 Tax=Agathobacter sp. TaxID=2021311 RepID=UPI0040572CA1
MQMKKIKKSFSLILCTMLIAAMALFTTGCGDNKSNTESQMSQQDSQTDSEAAWTSSQAGEQESPQENLQVLGEGENKFIFTVTDADAKETAFEIHTEKTKVGEALLDLELISGEEGAYGLYVKTVNGITADYETDKTYWAFYIDGEYAMTGVDVTDIKEGTTYSFKVEK